MKKIAVIITLFLSVQSFAQRSIDSLKTEADIEKFVEQYGKTMGMGWKNVSLTGVKSVTDSSSHINHVKHIDSLTKNKWLICDFNNDGKKDLIFNGLIENEKHLCSFLSDTGNQYQYFYLQKWYQGYYGCEIDTLHYPQKTCLCISGEYYKDYNPTTKSMTKILYTDTLQSGFGGFFEYTSNKNEPINFDTLQFKLQMSPEGYMNTEIPSGLSLQISNDCRLHYSEGGYLTRNFEVFDESSLDMSFTLPPAFKTNIDSILSNIGFYQLKPYYSINSNHESTASLTIRDASRLKLVIDYALQGTYGLRLLYKHLCAIMRYCRDAFLKTKTNNSFWNWY